MGQGSKRLGSDRGPSPAGSRRVALWKVLVVPLIWILGIGVAAKVGGFAVLAVVVLSLAGLGYAASVMGVDSRDGKDWPPPSRS